MPQREFGRDSDYYMALRSLGEGDQKNAERLFLRCAKGGSAWCARRSLEALTATGGVQDRLRACERLLSEYGDEAALLTAADVLYASGEYARLLRVTDGVDLAECGNRLAAVRLAAMYRKGDTRRFEALRRWFCSRPVSAEHFQFYREWIAGEEFPAPAQGGADGGRIPPDADIRAAVDFRISVYRRDYKSAYEMFPALRDTAQLLPQIVSDMGKACLYGSGDYLKNARIFDGFAAALAGTDAQFYAYFYAARLYGKAGGYSARCLSRLVSAMEAAATDENYDNALWYLLNDSVSDSADRAVAAIRQYCRTWHNPSYFDDFFETLSPFLIAQGRWNDFYEIYRAIDGFASDAAVAKYAYICGRLLQEGLLKPDESGTEESGAAAAFTRALTSGDNIYYRVMAVSRLGYGGDREEEILCNTAVDGNFARDADAERLLLGYAAFGLPEKIYPEWQALSSAGAGIGFACAARLAAFLNECGRTRSEYYPQALRISAKAFALSDVPIARDSFPLLYPRGYSDFVRKSCGKFGISEEIMYALIRTESFFDSGIVSAAGAVGLTQLMDLTAGDIARKLSVPGYLLKDAETNIEFGTYYLSELLRRLDGSLLSAFFSYNAGITRVRRWMKSARTEFGAAEALPDDLFLETIPYDETREYGRKLIAAASMYGWLYYGKSVRDVVSMIMK